MSDLFRREAVAHATQRLSGPVLLATPLSVKVLGLGLAGIIFAVVTFAVTATYARKATVVGWLVPDQGLIRATAQAPGLVHKLLVKEGDTVERGTQIAEIGVSAETAAGNVGEAVAKGLLIEAEALRARGEAKMAQLEAEAEQGRKRVEGLGRELGHARAQATLQQERLTLAKDFAAQSEIIAERGFLARRELDSRRSAALAAEQELAAQNRLVASLEREIVDLRARLANIPIEVAAARAERLSAEATLQQRSADAESRRAQVIIAPITGRIAAVPVAIGQSVTLGNAIAILTPVGGKLEAELLAPSRAAGFIRTGQEVRLMLQAFPHQRFGTVQGTIKSVSSTVLAPIEVSLPGLNVQEPVFRVRVSLASESVRAYGEPIPLQPGMLLAADIVFDRRTLIEWLFDPIYAVGSRA